MFENYLKYEIEMYVSFTEATDIFLGDRDAVCPSSVSTRTYVYCKYLNTLCMYVVRLRWRMEEADQES